MFQLISYSKVSIRRHRSSKLSCSQDISSSSSRYSRKQHENVGSCHQARRKRAETFISFFDELDKKNIVPQNVPSASKQRIPLVDKIASTEAVLGRVDTVVKEKHSRNKSSNLHKNVAHNNFPVGTSSIPPVLTPPNVSSTSALLWSSFLDSPQISSNSKNQMPSNHASSPKSLLDAFPLPSVVHGKGKDGGKNTSNNSKYDENLFIPYKKTLSEHIITNRKFLRANNKMSDEVINTVVSWLLRPDRQVDYNLPIISHSIRWSIDQMTDNMKAVGTETFRQQIRDQHEKFSLATSFSSDQVSLAASAIAALARYCAKHGQVLPLIVAWDKVKEAGIILSEEDVSTFLYVFGNASVLYSCLLLGNNHAGNNLLLRNFGAGNYGASSGSVLDFLKSPDEKQSQNSMLQSNPTSDRINHRFSQGDESSTVQQEDSDTAENIPAEVAVYHDLLYEPTERSISIRVKAFVNKGDGHSAQKLLDSFPSLDETRLRTNLPILKLYCEQGDVSSALNLFQRMRSSPNVHLDPETYILLISTLAERGFFSPDTPHIEGIDKIEGMRNNDLLRSGPNLFDFLLSQMSQDVLEITSASARRLYNALVQGFGAYPYAKEMKLIHSLSNLTPTNDRAKSSELVASRVTIDKETGMCPRTGIKLPLLVLDETQKKRFQNSLLELSNHQFEKFNSNKIKTTLASEELVAFANFLDNREGEPFTAIVDGANVAYYMQNFDGGKFNWFQVNYMVSTLMNMKENPLVLVPFKYCCPSFYNNTGNSAEKQILSRKEKRIIDDLLQDGRLYRVPPKCLDDYYWILASVSEQTKSRRGINLDVPPNNREGRWPGTRPMLITNDQMSDHKLEMLEPRLFRRWFSCHIVNYTFTAFVDDECADREIGFSVADFFSREIQSEDSNDGTIWHIPVNDWPLNDRLCIRLPR